MFRYSSDSLRFDFHNHLLESDGSSFCRPARWNHSIRRGPCNHVTRTYQRHARRETSQEHCTEGEVQQVDCSGDEGARGPWSLCVHKGAWLIPLGQPLHRRDGGEDVVGCRHVATLVSMLRHSGVVFVVKETTNLLSVMIDELLAGGSRTRVFIDPPYKKAGHDGQRRYCQAVGDGGALQWAVAIDYGMLGAHAQNGESVPIEHHDIYRDTCPVATPTQQAVLWPF
jgi:hypothetical protein